MGTRDIDYLKYFPFLSNSANVTRALDITIEKIETTNIYDNILFNILKEISWLSVNPQLAFKIKNYLVLDYTYEVTKFYLTIYILRLLDNIAVTRIWVNHFLKTIQFHIKELLRSGEFGTVAFFLTLFRLLEPDEKYKLKKINLNPQIETFGMHVATWTNVAAEVNNSDEERYQYLKIINCILHKGYVVIGFHEIDLLSSFIEYFAKIKIFQYYNNYDPSDGIIPSKKIDAVVKKLKDLILVSEKVSINVKKHHVPKELLYQQEKIRDVERSNIIIKDIIDSKLPNNLSRGSDTNLIPEFPPCVNVILEKIISKKIALSHNENILLCTYLAKKHFIKDHIIKIFSLATNYDKKVTDYQVSSLVEKDLMPMNCSNLQTEGICKKELDKTQQCEHLKNPLSFR